MEDITVNFLLGILKNERKTGELTAQPQDFYALITKAVNLAADNSDERRNISKLGLQIKELRTQKLLVYLAYNKAMPHPMPAEEEALYIQIKKVLNRSGGDIKTTKLKVTKTIPQIVTPTGSKLGPYEQNQLIYLSEISDIKFIIDNKLGEITD
jgi:ribosomal protein S15P/S13E